MTLLYLTSSAISDLVGKLQIFGPVGDFLFDVHFVDLENFQPLARFKVQKFAEVTKFVLGFKCDSSAPQTAGGECFYPLNK